MKNMMSSAKKSKSTPNLVPSLNLKNLPLDYSLESINIPQSQTNRSRASLEASNYPSFKEGTKCKYQILGVKRNSSGSHASDIEKALNSFEGLQFTSKHLLNFNHFKKSDDQGPKIENQAKTTDYESEGTFTIRVRRIDEMGQTNSARLVKDDVQEQMATFANIDKFSSSHQKMVLGEHLDENIEEISEGQLGDFKNYESPNFILAHKNGVMNRNLPLDDTEFVQSGPEKLENLKNFENIETGLKDNSSKNITLEELKDDFYKYQVTTEVNSGLESKQSTRSCKPNDKKKFKKSQKIKPKFEDFEEDENKENDSNMTSMYQNTDLMHQTINLATMKRVKFNNRSKSHISKFGKKSKNSSRQGGKLAKGSKRRPGSISTRRQKSRNRTTTNTSRSNSTNTSRIFGESITLNSTVNTSRLMKNGKSRDKRKALASRFSRISSQLKNMIKTRPMDSDDILMQKVTPKRYMY